MKIHFIAIGGSAMHNLAIALSRKGIEISGSDDEIFEPSRTRLKKEGILPKKMGWHESNIDAELDAVVLGMHARVDNPELQKAKELGVQIFSYPEYVYEQTKNKRRMVIGGSHGKTTITSMILHVCKHANLDADYLVGAQLEGYDCMVKLSEDTDVAIIEGDEYLSSPIDRRPKFHLYRPHVALITGIAWDHINVFPTFENYRDQFEQFSKVIEPNGFLVYYQGDEHLQKLAKKARPDITCIAYTTFPHSIENGQTYLQSEDQTYPIAIFGEHNLQNISGAVAVLKLMGLSEKIILTALTDFLGASKRLEKVTEKGNFLFYKDFAHAPSKLKATTEALKQQYPDRQLVACMELHTFSSLNKDFLPLYRHSMASADRALVYYNQEVVSHKKLQKLSEAEVKNAFASANVSVYTDSDRMLADLHKIDWRNATLLMMSSGNFDGIDFSKLGEEISAALE